MKPLLILAIAALGCSSAQVQPSPQPARNAPPALMWLARHQNPDGSWGAATFSNQCIGAKCFGAGESEFDVGVTALALLSFLACGFTSQVSEEFPDPVTPGRVLKFDKVVEGATNWLLSRQDRDGCVGFRGSKYMYNHAIATWALVESYVSTASGKVKGPAQAAVDFLRDSQNIGRGWRYSKKSGEDDTSVTGWAVLALTEARHAGLDVSDSAFEGARAWLDSVTDSTVYYRTGYTSKSFRRGLPGPNENFNHHESMTAINVLCRILMAKDKRNPAIGGVNLLVRDLPRSEADDRDFYYWYFATQVLFQYDGPDGPYWRKWSEPLKAVLNRLQKGVESGCAAGSWTSEDERWGFEGGRVYAVAINSLTLSTYYGRTLIR